MGNAEYVSLNGAFGGNRGGDFTGSFGQRTDDIPIKARQEQNGDYSDTDINDAYDAG